MRATPAAVAAVIAVALLAGCDATDSPPGAAGPPAGAPVGLSAEPVMAVGSAAGDTLHQFHRVVSPFRLPDGRLAVPLRGSSAIRLFDPDGSHAATLGGPGEGPGEFRSLAGAWARGDTIEAFDSRLLRITRFAPDGAVTTVPLERVPSAQSVVPGAFGAGWALYGVASAGGSRRDSIVVHRYDATGSHAGEIASLEGMKRFADGNFRGPTPLSPRPLLALADDKLYLGESVTPEVQVLDTLGGVLRTVRWNPAASHEPEQVWESVRDSAATHDGGGIRYSPEMFDAAPAPERLSAAWGLLVDDRGFLWLRPYDPLEHAAALGGLQTSGGGGEWVVLSPRGDSVGTMAVPDQLEPVQVTEDAVVGISRDSFGVESVRVYSLDRIAGPVSGQSEEQTLLELNRALFETQMLDRDASFLRSVSDDSYVVIAPGGVMESRDQVIRGLRAFAAVDSIAIQNERVVRRGSTAIVLNRLVIHGELRGPMGQLGPLSVMTVFSRGEEGEWSAVSRALTECNPRAVERGIC